MPPTPTAKPSRRHSCPATQHLHPRATGPLAQLQVVRRAALSHDRAFRFSARSRNGSWPAMLRVSTLQERLGGLCRGWSLAATPAFLPRVPTGREHARRRGLRLEIPADVRFREMLLTLCCAVASRFHLKVIRRGPRRDGSAGRWRPTLKNLGRRKPRGAGRCLWGKGAEGGGRGRSRLGKVSVFRVGTGRLWARAARKRAPWPISLPARWGVVGGQDMREQPVHPWLVPA